MVALQRRHNKFRARIRIPNGLQDSYGGKTHLQKTLEALDRPTARLEGEAWENRMKVQWAAQNAPLESPPARLLRQHHQAVLERAESGHFDVVGRPSDDPRELGLSMQLDRLEEEVGQGDFTVEQQARLAALQDALKAARGGNPARRKELESSFSETAADYVELWSTKQGLKVTNTRQQKEATFRLFAGHIGDKPLRDVTRADAAAFWDALRRLDPNWARSKAAKGLSWKELQDRFGGHPQGLSVSTMNRHMVTLQELWKWAEQRDRCEGSNPFTGLREKVRPGVNQRGYLPWEPEELQKLLDPPPGRVDLAELIKVALFTGMRVNEIAGLTYGQVREEGGVSYLQIEDAKTPAGNRKVPLHPALAWIADREGDADARLWPKFNPEGPGKKPGEDASKAFGDFKRSRGFASRQKAFHSFRKNVTQIMERAGVPENDWAQVLGLERGFTYGRYSPHGISLERKAEIVGLIAYPGVAALS